MSNNPKHKNVEIKCFARTRRGTLCQTPRITGKKRCRMHGGTSDGAPKGNKNAFKHGRYSKVIIENRKRTMRLKREFKALLAQLIA
jgi:glucans biosynthesis protein